MGHYKPHTEEAKRKISEAKKGKVGPWFGKTRPSPSPETRLKMSLANKGKHPKTNNFMQGETHTNWKGGLSKDRHKVCSLEYKQWVSDVFSRDNWTCQTCGVRSVYLQAHHIKSWARYPDLRFVVSNGVTLCIPCHKLTDNFGGKKQK